MSRCAVLGLMVILAAVTVGCSRGDEPEATGDGAVQVSPTAVPTSPSPPAPTPSPTEAPTSVPTLTPEPTASPSPTPGPAAGAGPTEHTPIPASPLTQEVTNKTAGYSIGYPARWLATERGDSVVIVHPTSMQVIVTVAPLQGLALEDFLDSYLEGISRSAEFTETSRSTLESPEALRVAGVLHGRGVFLVLDLIVTINGDKGLVAGSIASRYDVDLYKATMDSMLSSFETFPPMRSSAADRGGLWTGPTVDPALISASPALALFIIPGVEADVDLWRLSLEGIAFQCSPQRGDQGWELTGCTEALGQIQVPISKISVPYQGDELEVTFDLGESAHASSLFKLSQPDERRSSDNVSLLWYESSDGHSGVGVGDGVVFVPGFNGFVHILEAVSGESLGAVEAPEAPAGHARRVLDVEARDGRLYAGTSHNGLVIFDVTQPGTPQLVGRYGAYTDSSTRDSFFNVPSLSLSPDGDFVYAVNASFPEDPAERERSEFKSDLRVIDVSAPEDPVEVGRFSIDTEAIVSDISVIEIEGRLAAFLNYWDEGLWILDVTDPASISVLGSIQWEGIQSHSGRPFALGDRLYYAHAEEGYDRHLTVLEVTDLGDPKIVSRFQTRRGVSIHSVEVVDGIAYLAYYLDGLRVVDLRDPEEPREIGHFDTVHADSERSLFQGAFGVRVVDGVAYVSDSRTGTYAIEVGVE